MAATIGPPGNLLAAARRRPFRLRHAAMSRPPFPPFNAETAAQKARLAEDAWNTREPARVALAYTPDSRWRNRSEFLQGRAAIEAFLTRKWAKVLDHRLIKAGWPFRDNRIAVRFAYEWHDDSGSWFRSYGWEFDEQGLMWAAHRQHQRPADQKERTQISLAAQPPSRRSPPLSDLGL
jgi:nuclear transport factor 2 (NTF2) superfamily protein